VVEFKRTLQHETDVLVIGSGAAGCAAAIAADEYGARVLMIAKGAVGRTGNTNLAGVVFAAGIGHTDPRDNPRIHLEDTILEGRFLSDQKLVKLMCDHAPHTVYDLARYGVEWYLMEDGKHFLQAPTPGHRYNRGVHHDGRTGEKVQQALNLEIARHPDIQSMDDVLITTLLVQGGAIAGAAGIDLKSGDLITIAAGSVVVATGGAGKIFSVTDMETGSTGDGMVWCLRAGARLVDPEMHQFFPTAFVHPETLRGTALATSALWVYGLRLFNIHEERFMERYFPDEKENVPRDVLSQCILKEIIEGRGTEHGGVWLDTYEVENWEHWRRDRARSYIWPSKLGVDVRRAQVAPTSHYTLGGVKINEHAETGVPGLYAAGEVAGGIHGANRIGGNALTDCMVFGEIAGREAALSRRGPASLPTDLINGERERLKSLVSSSNTKDGVHPAELIEQLRRMMYRKSGVVRSSELLESAKQDLIHIRDTFKTRLIVDPEPHFNAEWIWALELDAMLTISELTVQAAIMRTESRGAHFRVDHPYPDNEKWLKHVLVHLDHEGEAAFDFEEVEFTELDLIPGKTDPPFRELEVPY
jgi:fumarate reductase (CoM/CoB) subunit A